MLSVAWQRLARPFSPLPPPADLTTDNNGTPPIAPCIFQCSRPKTERCRVGGLRTTPCGFLRFPHANPKPDSFLRQVTVGGETETAHIKQCFVNKKGQCEGANPPPVSVSKTRKPLKATFRLRPCLISLRPKALGKAEYSLKWPKLVTRNSNERIINTTFPALQPP